MKTPRLLLCAMLMISGCQFTPGPLEPWSALNEPGPVGAGRRDPTSVHGEKSLSRTVSAQADKLPGDPGQSRLNSTGPMSLPLEKAIYQYIPGNYHIEIDPDVDIQSVIAVDGAGNWLEALGQGMYDADIEFITNLYRKSVHIKRSKTTLEQAIDQLIPNDYTVFTHADIDLTTLIHFDRRQFWVEALSNGVGEIGVDLTIHFTDKSIYLKPARRHTSNTVSTATQP